MSAPFELATIQVAPAAGRGITRERYAQLAQRVRLLCAYLAGALLVGLLGNALIGAWWLDPVVGLLIAGVAVREGREAWRGEGCCVSSSLGGAGFADDACPDECCAPPAR